MFGAPISGAYTTGLGAMGTAPGEQYWDVLFNRATADTTLTTMNVGVTSTQGTYSPKANGHLVLIEFGITPQAASSLAQTGYIVLTCTLWVPVNSLTFFFTGFGLATAPQAQNPVPIYKPCNLPISTSVAITGQDIFQYSPVTPAIYVNGLFTSY